MSQVARRQDLAEAKCADELILHDREVASMLAQCESRPIQYVNWAGLSGEPPPREWFINDWLTPAPTLLAGAGGLGKSLFMQALCTALSIGRDFLGCVPQPRRCLILSCEDDKNEAWRRQTSINRYFGLQLPDLGNLFISPRVGQPNVLVHESNWQIQTTDFFDLLQQEVNDLSIDVLVIDNIAHTYGANSVDAHRVTWFINQLQGMVKGRPFAPILIGHPSRKEDSEFSGSAAWENAVRMRWHLRDTPPDSKAGDPDVIGGDALYIARRKSNYTVLGFETLVRKDGIVVPHKRTLDPVEMSALMAAHENIVMEGLAGLRTLGMLASDAETASNNLPRKLQAMGLAEGATVDQLTRAMHRLIMSGRLVRRRVRMNGKDRFVLEAV